MLVCDKTTYGHTNIRVMGPHNLVSIGKYCSIAENIIIDGGFGHKYWHVSTYPFDIFIQSGEPSVCFKGDVIIKNDVYIGMSSLIKSGVTIGNGAVIGTHSVVTHDVPDYAIVAGVPARIIKYRFSPEVIEKLLKIAWWDWPEEKIHQNAHLICSPNIDQFINENQVL